MFRRHGAKGHAHDGVGTGGEDIHLALANQRAIRARNAVGERKAHAFGFANPVFLHQTHFVWPAVQGVFVRATRCGFGVVELHKVEQLLCVAGDVQVVPWNFAFFHCRAGAPAFAVNDLFIGEHGLIDWVPVDDLGFAVSNAFFKHLQKQPLVPLVVAWIAGGDFARPVDRQTHGLHLLLHVGNVVKRPLGGRHAVFECGVFGGQAKGVPAHGHQDVVALHAQIAREHVVDGVVAHMAHVQLAAGIGQHGAGVELLFARVFAHAVDVALHPSGLQGAFELGVVVFFLHGVRRINPAEAECCQSDDFRAWRGPLWTRSQSRCDSSLRVAPRPSPR